MTAQGIGAVAGAPNASTTQQLINLLESGFPVLTALVGALASAGLSHYLTTKREAKNAEDQRTRDRARASQHEQQLDQQRRDARDEREEQQRVAAVKSYYEAFVDATLESEDDRDGFRQLGIAQRLFAFEVLPLNSTVAALSRRIHTITIDVRMRERMSGTPGNEAYVFAVHYLFAHQDLIFGALMEWAATNKPHKLDRALDEFEEAARALHDDETSGSTSSPATVRRHADPKDETHTK